MVQAVISTYASYPSEIISNLSSRLTLSDNSSTIQAMLGSQLNLVLFIANNLLILTLSCIQIAESKELTEGALIRVGEYMVNQVQGLQ